jgi:two-component system chemotaxis sensor kinase CheA
MDEIISEFLVESYEGLDQLDQGLIELEESPGDVGILKEIFRTLHTIKGTCGFLGFTKLEKLAHAAENLLSLLRDGELSMSAEIADALLAAVGDIRGILATIDATEQEGDPDIDNMVTCLNRLANGESAAGDAATEDAGSSAEAVAPEAAIPAEVDAADAAAEPIEAPAEPAAPDPPAAPEPPAAPAEPAPVTAEEPAADTAPAAADTASAAADAAPAAAPAAPTPPAAPEPAGTEDEDRIGDILVDQGSAKRDDVEIAAAEQSLGDKREIGKILVDQGKAANADVEQAAASQRKSSADTTIRVDVALLDRLMNLVGELVLSRNQIIQLATDSDSNSLGPPAQRLNLITSELQEGVMKTRMQPINNVWAKLPRVVRDLSRQLGKHVRVEMIGKETELDRTIIEAIKDPLTHIVRNTVDHGVETPEERIAAGKPEEGVLLLRASHEGGQVNIEISDDGKGMNAQVLANKAVEKGVVTPEQVAKMSEQEMLMLIFKPGFSTAAQVSNVSGRGVGMDVVKTNVERIGGTVDLKTEAGVGTTFKIKIPLTLAIIPALVVSCDGNRYAIPQVNLLELVRLEADDANHKIEDLHGAPVYRLRGRLLPIVDLRDQLGSDRVQRDSTNIVVLKADEHKFGLIVDSIEDTEEIVVKPLGRQVKDLSLFSGATIMGDGRIALILDLLGLAAESRLLEPGTSEGTGQQQADEAADTNHSAVLDDRTLLLLGLGDDERVAIPLAKVERLEEFPSEALERSDGRTVVQYRNRIMPIIDLAPTIGYMTSAFEGTDRISVVVCAFGDIAVGLAVQEIVDIVAHAEVLKNISDDFETVVINDQVTDVIDATSVVSSVLPLPAIEESASFDDHYFDAELGTPTGV